MIPGISRSSSSGRRHSVIRVDAYVVFSVFRVWSCVGLVFRVFRVWYNVLVLVFVSCCDSRFGLVLVIAGLLVHRIVGMNRTRNYALSVLQQQYYYYTYTPLAVTVEATCLTQITISAARANLPHSFPMTFD